MKNKDIYYACGFIDGEGCITTSAGYNFRITISSTDKSVLIWFHKMFGGSINNQHLPKNPKHSMAWKWVLCRNNEVYNFLKTISPHLKLKQAQAKEIIKYFNKYPPEKNRYSRSDKRKEDYLYTKKRLKVLKNIHS